MQIVTIVFDFMIFMIGRKNIHHLRMSVFVFIWRKHMIFSWGTCMFTLVYIHPVAVLDLSNWRGSAPVFCGAPKGEEFGEGALSLKLGGLTLNWRG